MCSKNRFDAWADDKPSGNGDCMKYSAEHNFFWEDFTSENYVDKSLFVRYLCEENMSNITACKTMSSHFLWIFDLLLRIVHADNLT